MRISGQIIGAPVTMATRRSVIFSSDGFDAVRTFCVSASRSSWVTRLLAKAAPAAPAVAVRKKLRRSAPRADSARRAAGFMAASFPNGRPAGSRGRYTRRAAHKKARGPPPRGSPRARSGPSRALETQLGRELQDAVVAVQRRDLADRRRADVRVREP